MATTWVAGNRYLTQAEMENNAQMFYLRMTTYGFSLNAIAGMLGNIQTESGINPGIWENLDPFEGGYGLVQWTPYSNYSNWAGAGWENNGDKQCERINYEFANGLQYYPTGSHPLTAGQFKVSNDSAADLAETFLYNYERPSDPSASVAARRSQGTAWYQYLLNTVAYTPRLDYTGTDTLPYYTTYNPYWSWGTDEYGNPEWLGMNNCTAYAFGRWNELAQVTGYNTNWPVGNGADWVADGIAKGYASGTVPQLGAAISWKKVNEQGVLTSNHVAIVEEIQYDSNGNPVSFTISQSAFNNGQPAPGHGPRGPQEPGYNFFPWFWTDTVYMNDLDYDYDPGSFQGFLYHPNISPTPPVPPTPTGRRMPFIFYLKRIL